MAVITTGNYAKALIPGINAWFGDEYKDHETFHPQVFAVSSSDRNFEEDVLTSGLGLGKIKPEGSAVSYDDASQGYTKRYTHVVYANGFIITREAMEDGMAPLTAEKHTRSLKRGMLQTKDIVCTNVLNRGFDSTYTGGDGKELFASNHPTRAQDLRNELTTTVDISEAALEQAMIDIADYRDDRGLRMSAKATKLIVPKESGFEVERILKSSLRVGTAENDLNALKSMSMIPEGYIIGYHLTDTDAWFLKTDVPDGLKVINRRALAMDSDNEFDTFNAKFIASERFDVGWTDPRGMFGVEGA